MSENLGSIYWNVDADTTGAVSSQKQLEAQTKKVTTTLTGMDEATTKSEVKLAKLERVTGIFTAALKKNGSQIQSNGVVLDKYGQINVNASNRLAALTAQQAKLSKTSAGVKKAMAGMGRSMGQAGIQLQQLIGQVQGGQSFMLALSQQSADLGFVLGAPLLGAIAGISASLVSMLIPSLMDGKTATEELEAALELIKDITYETSDGTLVLSDSVEKLAKKSKALAEIEIALGMVNAQKAIKAANKEIMDASDDWENTFSFTNIDNAVHQISNLEKAAKRMGISQVEVMNQIGDSYEGAILEIGSITTAVSQVKEEFGASDNQALGFLKTIEQLKANKTPENMAAVAAAVHYISTSLAEPNEKLLTLDKRLNSAALSAMSAKEMLDLLEKASKDMGAALDTSSESVSKNRDQVDEMIKSLKNQLKMMKETDRWTALRIAKEKGATAEQLKAIATVYTRIEAEEERVKKVKELDKAEEEAAKNAAKRIREEQKAIDDLFKEDLKANITFEKDRNTGKDFAKETMQPEGENDAITQLQEEHAKLLELKAKFVEDSLVYDQALTANEKAQADERLQYNLQTYGLISSSLSSAFGSMAEIIKTNAGEQSSSYKKMFAVSKGFAVAQAGLNFALAVSNASAVTPWYSSLAAVAETTAAGAGVISAVSNAAYSGREHGGSVNAGQTYEVGEKNKPEMLMIPGNNGKVFSNAEMKGMMNGGGGNGNSAPIINNYGAANGVSVEHERDAVTKQDVFNIVYSQNTNPNSRSRRAQTGSTNIKSQLGGRRRS